MKAVCEGLNVSERRACTVLGQYRSTQRHAAVVKSDENALTKAIVQLASGYGRYRYRRVTGLLREAGVASLTVIGKFLGRRSAFTYLASNCLCAIILGIILNQIYLASEIGIKATIGKAGEIIPRTLKTISAVILLFLMANVIYHEAKESHE